MAVPLIRPLQVQGGTFYAFSSAANDISKTFTDDNSRFIFSKFACLNIPNVSTPTNKLNNIVWEAIGGTGGDPFSALSTDQNVNLAQSFENYVLNLEELILDGQNDQSLPYDTSIKKSTSERIFWKWMTKINAIRFRNADTTSESNVSSRYTEEDPATTGSQQYSKVVEYLGDLDIVNNVSRNGNAYSEVYIHIPTSHGNTPLVLFKTDSDNNYLEDLNWVGDDEFIKGRSSSTVHPAGLDLHAYYDNDSLNEYNAGATFGNVSNVSSITNSKPIFISKMDGVAIDWDVQSYTPVTNNPPIQFLPEFNGTAESSDFSFNAVLIYYDTYNTSNTSDRATNLYGILILDDYTNTVDGGSLKAFNKFKFNPVTKLNGNSYGLKLNIKFDTNVDNASVQTVINEYNTFSMDLFMDASTRLQEASDMFLKQNITNLEISQRIKDLESFFYSQASIQQLKTSILSLQSQLNNSNLAFQSSTTLLDLISKTNDQINQILAGKTPLEVQYNLDVLDFGDGISLDTSVKNKIKISNKNQEISEFTKIKNNTNYFSYDINNGTIDTTNVNYDERNNILVLGKFRNYFRNTTPDSTLVRDVIINIDDKNTNWKTGQTMRIVFQNEIDLVNNSLLIYTDTDNRFGSGSLKKFIGGIDASNLISNKPIIDIICSNENTYEFYIDIVK